MNKYSVFLQYRFGLLKPLELRDKQLADKLLFHNLSFILDSKILRESTDPNFSNLVGARLDRVPGAVQAAQA